MFVLSQGILKPDFSVTVDQRGQLKKERTVKSSAWLRFIMRSNGFTLETIALSFSGGRFNSPFFNRPDMRNCPRECFQ